MKPKPMLVTLCVIRHAGRILLLNRRKPPYAGYWCLPGGKIEFGERVEEAAIREIREETGLVCKDVRCLAVATETIAEADAEQTEAHFVMFVVAAEVDTDRVCAGEEGELAWFEEAAFTDLQIIPTDLEMIRRYAEGILKVDHYRVDRDGDAYRLHGIE